MKKFAALLAVVVLGAGLFFGWDSLRRAGAELFDFDTDDPDMPSHLKAGVTKEEFMIMRAEGVGMKRGIHKDQPFDRQARPRAVEMMEEQEAARRDLPNSPEKENLLAAWTEIGPMPIPNAQVGTSPTTTASGRTLAIAIHPTNPDIVYAGAAQGGLYRSTNGGTTWTPLMDTAQSLAISSIAMAPSNPEILYIGTGEPGFCGDCFFGVGIYRIDNASTTATLSGPFNRETGTNADIFTGRSIGDIMVHPTDPNIIFVASASGVGGIGGQSNNVLPSMGIYRSTNATSASPTFAKLTGLAGNLSARVRDIQIDPADANILVANVANTNSAASGLYRTTNALAANPADVMFTQTLVFSSSSTSELTGEFAAIHPPTDADATFYAAVGNLGGRVLKSTDGGATWTQQIDNNFCSPQCFYDIAIAVDPVDPTKVFIGGAPSVVFARSTNSGVTFTSNSATARGLHVDSHAIAISRSNPSVAYFGSDGGIYRTDDVNASTITWTSLNNTTYSATQFMSIAVHPTDPNFTIGGTQDNGTNRMDPSGAWFRVDGGDGGFVIVDQNATDTTTVRQYHAYFTSAGSQVGYATRTSTASVSGGWTQRGCFGSTPNNGITCDPAILFYAPLEPGPGNPNTVYFGSDRLYRSDNLGVNHTVVSQAPIEAGVPISSIGISPQNDNVRIVGLRTGGIYGTVTGSTTLTNLDPLNQVPAPNYISRAVIDPQNVNRAYVTLSNFGVANVYRCDDISAAQPTWTPITNGLPQVAASSFVIDPLNSNNLFVGTDIGVYASTDMGASWQPLGTGLPRVAVFDMAITGTEPRKLRIATHGRGMWDHPMGGGGPTPTPTATPTNTPTATPTPGGGFESDVSPRPNGDLTVTANDVVQVRRFATGLDSFGGGTNEGQRADCAPLASLGDGTMTSGDVVQARRFAAGLDPLTAAGGPNITAQAGEMATQSFFERLRSYWTESEMRFGHAAADKSAATVPIIIDAAGGEMAVGFSLEYDPAQLSAPIVTLADGSTLGATVTMNIEYEGRITVLIDMSEPLARTGSPRTLVNVRFEAPRASGLRGIPVRFARSTLGAADVSGNTMPLRYANAAPAFRYER